MSIEKELTIRLVIDDQAAKKIANAQIAGFRKIEDAAARSALATEKAARKAADAFIASEKRKDDAAQKAAAKITASGERAASRIAAATKKAAEDAAAAWEKNQARSEAASAKVTAKIRADFQKLSSQQAAEAEKLANSQIRAGEKVAQAEANRVARLQDLGRQILSKDEINLRARASANQKFQQQRVDAATKIMVGDREATSATQELIGAGLKVGAGFVGVAAVGAGFRAVVGEINDAREASIKFAQDLLRVKDQLAELATLRGSAFANDETVKRLAGFSQATGMSIGEADEYQKEFFGSSQGGLDKGYVDQETLDKAAVIGGRAAKRQTKDFKTRGDVTGLLTQLHDYKHDDNGKEVSADVAAKAIASDVEGVRLGLTDGRGSDSALSRSFANVAGSLAGDGMIVPDARKLSSLIGVMSLSAGPGMADTRAEQYVRGLRGSTPQQMEFMKQFTGRDEHDNLETQADKFHKAMLGVKAKGRDATEFLTENHVPEEQIKALVEGDRNYDVLKKRFRKAENPDNAKKLDEDNARFKASPLGRLQFGEADKAAAQLREGKRREALEAELPGAESEILDEGLNRDMGYIPGNIYRNVMSGFQVKSKDQRVEQRALERLRKRAGNPALSPFERDAGVGIDPAAGYAELSVTGKSADAANYYQKLIDALAENTKQTKLLADQQAAANKPTLKPAPPLMGAGPPAGMQRPNAGP